VTLAEIKAHVDLTNLGPHFGLDRVGNGFLCPFHEDHTPSLGVRGCWFRCFACDAKGDVFDLVAHLLGCTFREAVEAVCEHLGLQPPSVPGRVRRQPLPTRVVARAPDAENPAITPERRVEILTRFARASEVKPETPDDHPALAYLNRRGISPGLARSKGIGFVSDYRAAQKTLLKLFPLPDLQAAGLFNAKANFRLFRHRLVIPFLFDREAHGLQARNIDWKNKDEDGPKELLIGSPRIPFNADILAEAIEQVFLTEGAVDCLSLAELGLTAVGIPGAMGFKPEWTALFAGVPEIVVAFDQDDAGRRGARKVAGAFDAAGRGGIKTVQWPPGIKDANDFILSSAPGEPGGSP
jgi:DNA primase